METHRSRGMEMSETCPSLGRRMAMTIVSVRNDVPERLSDPISRKLTVSSPLERTWLSNADTSIVGCGATVLIRKLGSIVGMSVGVRAGGVAVGVAESAFGEEKGETV